MRLLTLVASLLAIGCADLCAPTEPLPAGAHEVSPTPRYERLWQQVDSCSGRPRSIAGLRIYVIPGIVFTVRGVKMTSGYQPEHDRVLLSVWADSESSGSSIRHEFLHAHLPADADHPREYFGTPGVWTDGKCGRLVNFGG